jgi:hypothetical protein
MKRYGLIHPRLLKIMSRLIPDYWTSRAAGHQMLLNIPGSQTILDVIRTWEQLIIQHDYHFTARESLIDAFASTLRLNLPKERLPNFHIPTLKEWQQTFKEKYSFQQIIRPTTILTLMKTFTCAGGGIS